MFSFFSGSLIGLNKLNNSSLSVRVEWGGEGERQSVIGVGGCCVYVVCLCCVRGLSVCVCVCAVYGLCVCVCSASVMCVWHGVCVWCGVYGV